LIVSSPGKDQAEMVRWRDEYEEPIEYVLIKPWSFRINTKI
jgi:hypothetical protein